MSLSRLVFRAGCRIRLCRFLIIAFLSTLQTISNAPKWSRDLTKLMNPEVENDWRLLASRLGYTNADIRGWATQHDPCMALLSEWYATHKTSEASYAVLTVLTEINRLDGAAIVENAMKQAGLYE